VDSSQRTSPRAAESTANSPTSIIGGFFRSNWPFAIGILLAIALQLWLPNAFGRQSPYYVKIGIDIGIAIIMAVSLNIVNGLTGQFSIGHAGFMALGGYSAGAITYYGSLWLWGTAARHGGWLGAGEWLFAFSCVCGGILAAAAGYVVGLPSLRLRGDYLAIVTLGFGEIVRVLLQQTGPIIEDAAALRSASFSDFIPPPVGGALGFSGLPKYTNLFWVYLFAAVTLIIAYRIKMSGVGRALLSIREDEIAAQSMGVNIARTKVLAFVLAAFFAGAAGGLFGHESGVNLRPSDAGFLRSFDFIIMVVLGGRGSVSGVTLSAAILTMLPEFLREFDIEQYRLIVYALLLIVMMLVRPQGLFGIHEIWDVWPKRRKSAPDGDKP
jgi:branched-chain amino acid transport system permease protein